MSEEWDRWAQVVVVGAGGAGLAAAVSAAEAGARVLLLEKNPRPGGTTGIAVGSFTAVSPSVRKGSTPEDDPRWHDEDMGKFAGQRERLNNADLRLHFACHSGPTLDWLRGLGIEFHGPSPEPPNRVPRMYNVIPNAKAYIATLQRRAQSLGTELIADCRVTRLVRDRDGSVIGVEADRGGQRLRIGARQGVILAAGDYSNGAELKRRFLSEAVADIEGINPTATGDGHRLGEEAGAALTNMELVYGPEIRFVPPPRAPFTQLLPAGPIASRVFGSLIPLLPKRLLDRIIKGLLVTWQHPEPTLFRLGAILVNGHGDRFVDETAAPELAIPRQEEKLAYLVFDAQIGRALEQWPNFISTAPDIAYAYLKDYRRDRPDICKEAPTVAALAGRIGVAPAALQATIGACNRAARGEAEDPFGRAAWGPPLISPPFWALGPAKSYLVTTEGGLRVDRRMRVLSETGAVIGGLYAAGCNGLGGQVLWGHGLHIAWAMTSGRLAGLEASRTE